MLRMGVGSNLVLSSAKVVLLMLIQPLPFKVLGQAGRNAMASRRRGVHRRGDSRRATNGGSEREAEREDVADGW